MTLIVALCVLGALVLFVFALAQPSQEDLLEARDPIDRW